MSGHAGVAVRTARWADGPFVGRDDVLADLVRIVQDAIAGNGAVVLVTGEAGIGKTTVVRALADRVRGDIAVSWGSAPDDRAAPPLWPWRSIVRVQPGAGEPDAEPVGVRRLEQLGALSDELCGSRPARLHVIEDLQWADVSSVMLAAEVGHAIEAAPLVVLATIRTEEPASPELGEALEAVRRVARLHDLRPLGDDDIGSLVRGLGVEPDADLIRLVRHRTGGNPLFVTELLRAVPMVDDQRRWRDLLANEVPARVTDLVRYRLDRLPAAVTEALGSAAVIGSEGSTATLAAAHGVDPAALLDLLDQARAAHVLDGADPAHWQFRHQLMRDALYVGLGAADLARRHAQVLDVLAADGSTPPSVLARHALAALPLFDPDRAVALAARAGEDAFGQHAYEEAVAWFGRALAAAPPATEPRWRAELLILCGEAHRHTGRTEQAREAFLQAADLTDDPALLARAALGHADPGADLGIAYRSEDPTTIHLLERAIAVQASAPSPASVQLRARLAAELYFSDDPARGRVLAESALEQAQALGDPRAALMATAVVHDAFVVGQADLGEQLAESQRLLEWAAETDSTAARLTAHRARVLDLVAAGDMAAVDREIVAFRRIAEPLRVPGYLWWPAVWSAMAALLEGRHDEAERRAVAAFEMGAAAFPVLSFMNMSFLLFFLRREQGRLAEMEDATRRYAAERADVPALRVSLAFLVAEIGRIDEAREMAIAFDDAALARVRDRNWPASWFQLARVAFLVGDADLARRLLRADHRPSERCVQVSLATVCLGSTDLAAAWLLQTVGDLDAADEHYRSAQECNLRIGARSWLAQARADHAGLLAERGRAGDRDAADDLVRLAGAAAAEIGLVVVVEALARHDSGRAPRPGPARFVRRGQTWELCFAGRTVQVPEARGLRDLAFLLSRQNEAVSVLELAGTEGTAASAARGAEALDERARREIRDRLHQLDADEAEAEANGDGEAAAFAREARQALAEAVSRDLGLGGRSRLVGDPVERARKTVSTRIRRTIASVGRAHPDLGRHLERSIDTGTWCAYRPAEPVDWTT